VLVGSSGPDSTAAAIAQGAELVIIGAQLQRNPLCILSLASSAIPTPADMVGKTIGLVDGISVAWESFLAANDLDPASIDVVPAGYDPTPLTVGDWDGYVAYATNEPASLELAGFPTAVLLWADYGYEMVTQTYVAKKADVTSQRDKIKALLLADIRGWRDNAAEPDVAPSLVVDTYGKDLGLTVEHQRLVNKNQTALMVTDETDANGLFTVTPERIELVVETLRKGGSEIDAATLFDMSLLTEIYEEHPDLKAPVTPG
jgi:ABC-type nitrate/sulfonate/bicarbonate transport system substrate-binding protein